MGIELIKGLVFDDNIWSDGLQVLRREEECVGYHVRRIGIAVPTIHQSSAGANDVERG